MRRKSPRALQKAARRSKRTAKRMGQKISHLLSDENPSYLEDKEKLLKLLKGSSSTIPNLFYDVESYLKSKMQREEVFKFCTEFVNGRMNRKDVIYFLNYEEPKKKGKKRWWPYKK